MANRSARLDGAQLIAISLILTLGMGFRLYGLDHKVYWHDEVFTSLRAAGYIGEEVAQQLLEQSQTGPVTAAELQQFQQISPDKTWADTWASLKTHPEHPPLFYLLERAWMAVMGSSIAATRGLSALFSIALFPLVAWFCNGLGHWSSLLPDQAASIQTASTVEQRSPRPSSRGQQVAAVAIALLAISPVQVLYAQEAREYSLWACEIILASGLLLQAVGRSGQTQRSRSWRVWSAWLAYGGAIALGLYTTLLTGLIIIAHGIYLLPILLKQRAWPLLKSWLGAIAAAALTFSPWLWVAAEARQKLSSVTAWTQVSAPLEILSKLWGLHLSASFIDLGLPLEHPYSTLAPIGALLLVILSWLAILQRGRWFLLVMMVVPALLLILPDLLQGGQRSSVTRYFMPLVLMALITVALGMTQRWRSGQRLDRLACQLLLAGLLTAGTVSCYKSAIAPAWWNKSFNFVTPAMANYIAEAQTAEPTTVWVELSSNGLGNAIALSHRVPPQTPFRLFKRSKLPEISRSPVLIPYASGDLLAAIQEQYGQAPAVVAAPEVYELWQVNFNEPGL